MTTLTVKDLANSNLSLLKINQDAYSGEYFKRVSNTEYRVKVRHTTEKVTAGSRPMARHNVDFTVTQFQTDSTPPKVRQAYFVLRQPISEDDTSFTTFSKNLALFLTDGNISSLIGWDTDIVGVV